MPDLRLISAEMLKLRRRRGMLSIALLLTAGAAALVFIVMAIQHGGDPKRYGPAGGLENYREDISFLGMMVLVVGAIIGATAGTQDIESGVFRDLVATGRSRLALFFSRVAGAWAVALPIAGLAAGITAVASVALAGSLAAPGTGALVAGTAALLAGAALSTAMAVGLSALVGSRGPVIGVLLAFFLAIQPLLSGIGLLGGAREFIPYLALERIGDMPQTGPVQVALGTAVLAVVMWAAVALGVGAWRTRTREI